MKRFTTFLLAMLMMISTLPLSAYAADLAKPTFSKESGAYDGSVKVSISTTNLFADIYYEIYEYGMSNFKGALKQSATKYTSSLTITEPCYITAWTERNNETSEAVTNRYYIRYASDEGRFTVDENGTLTAYTGNTSNLVIPETVNGVTVTAIGNNCFDQYDRTHQYTNWYNTDDYSNFLQTVTLPDTCTQIGKEAFACCKNLTAVYGGNVTNFLANAFIYCSALETIDLANAEHIYPYAFHQTGIKRFENDKITGLAHNAFQDSAIEYINLPNLTGAGKYAFDGCANLKEAKLDGILELPKCIFTNCPKLETVSAVSLTEVNEEAFVQNGDDEYHDKISVYAPSLVIAKGGSIRLSDSGLRFGFEEKNDTEFQQKYPLDVKYGFSYGYGNDPLFGNSGVLTHQRVVSRYLTKGGFTSYNLVFTDIPKANYNTEISVRAFVQIENVVFYSDIITRSFEGVANAVLADDTMDEATKEQVRNILEA